MSQTYLQQQVKCPALLPSLSPDFIHGKVFKTVQNLCVRQAAHVKALCRISWRWGGFLPTPSDKCCIHAEVRCMLGQAIWANGFWAGWHKDLFKTSTHIQSGLALCFAQIVKGWHFSALISARALYVSSKIYSFLWMHQLCGDWAQLFLWRYNAHIGLLEMKKWPRGVWLEDACPRQHAPLLLI